MPTKLRQHSGGYMITQDELKALLHYDQNTGVFTNLTRRSNHINIGAVAGSVWTPKGANTSYLQISINSKMYYAHRLAWLYVYGEWPENHIDHIDGCGTNNAISNLRDVSQSVNHRNALTRSNNTSGHSGVNFNKGKWRAYIKINAKQIHLGYFTTFEEAIAARLAASKEHGFIHRPRIGNS